jgi:uncharacterized membrane protein YqjE
LVEGALELLAAGWSYLRARGELAGIEGREAGMHWLVALGLLVGGLVLVSFGWLFLCLATVFLIAAAIGTDTAWIWITFGAAFVHVAAAGALFWKVWDLVKRPFFPATLEEFRKDQAWLNAKSAKGNS